MVKKIFGCWLILCVGVFFVRTASATSSATGSAAQLEFHLQHHHVEWGQSIHAKLIAHHAKDALAEIDLTPLQEDFALVTEAVTSDGAASTQSMNLELFPRRTGGLTIPALVLGEMQTQTQTVKISNAIIHGKPLIVDLNVSAQQVWQRQQLLVTVEVQSPDRFFNIEAQPFNSGSFEVRPFVMNRETLETDASAADSGYGSRIRAGWAVFPLLSGDFTLELPMIRYLTGGKINRRFFLPRITVRVRELPAYIPPNMPVAKVSVASEFMTNGWLRTGHMAYWNITLDADGTLAYWLPPVLHHIQSSNQVEYLPAKSWPSVYIDAGGTHARVVHQVPFKPQSIGNVDLPQLKIQYFDPDTGRIETVYHQTPPPFAWNTTVFAVVLLLMMFLLFKGRKRIAQKYQRITQKRTAIRALEEANTPQRILIALRQLAVAEGWPANLTVSDFLRLWKQRYIVASELTVLFAQLSRSVYGSQSDAALRELQWGLISQLRQTRRHRKPKVRRKNPAWDVKNIFTRG
jgi:hypothetical protein